MAGRCAHVRAPALLERQDRVTGDWSSFWQARDYLTASRRVRAARVRGPRPATTSTCAPRPSPPGGTGSPPSACRASSGCTTAVTADPAAPSTSARRTAGSTAGCYGVPQRHRRASRACTIQREDGSYADEADWPAAGARVTRLKLSATSRTGPGSLAPRTTRGRQRKQSFVDRGRELDTDDASSSPSPTRPTRTASSTARPRSRPRRSPERHAARPTSGSRSTTGDAANLTAVLVDYGPDGPEMVTRGWLDPQNRVRRRPQPPGPARPPVLASAGTCSPTTTSSPPATASASSSSRPTTTTRCGPRRGRGSRSIHAASELRLPIVGGAAALGLA